MKLSKLGTNSWEKKKLSAKKAIKDTAAELLQLYAQEFEKSSIKLTITPLMNFVLLSNLI